MPDDGPVCVSIADLPRAPCQAVELVEGRSFGAPPVANMPSKGVLEPGLAGRGPSYIRVTTPANLELALEGLVRKVLKEQPKQEDIYSFAADYFEHLVQIRDKAENQNLGVLEICPGHSEAEANELIKLATSFAKPAFLRLALREEPCNVVDVEVVQNEPENLPHSGGEAEVPVKEEEVTPSEQEPEEESTISEKFQEGTSEKLVDSKNETENVDGETETKSEEVLQNSDLELSDKNSTECEVGEPEQGLVPQSNAEDRQSDDIVQETVTDVAENQESEDAAEDRQSEDIVQESVNDVAENQESEDTAEDQYSVHVSQDAVTEVAEGKTFEDIAEDEVTKVAEEPKASSIAPALVTDRESEDVGTDITENAEDVTQNGVSGVSENVEDQQDAAQNDTTDVSQEAATGVAENVEDQQPQDAAQDGTTDVSQEAATGVTENVEDQQSQDSAQGDTTDVSQEAATGVTENVEDQQSQDSAQGDTTDVSQEAATAVTENVEDHQSEDATQDGITDVAEDIKSQDVAETAVTDVTEHIKSQDVAKDAVTGVTENAENQQVISDVTQDAVTDIPEDKKNKDVVTDVTEIKEDQQSNGAVTNDNTESLNEASDRKSETEQVLQDDMPTEQLPQDDVTETASDKASLLENDEKSLHSQEVLPVSSEIAELPTEDSPPVEIPPETPTEATTEDIPSERSTAAVLLADNNPTTDISTDTEPTTENISTPHIPPELSTEDIPTSIEVTTGDVAEVAELPTEDNSPTQTTTEPTTEDTPPHQSAAGELATEDSSPAEIPTEMTPVTESTIEDSVLSPESSIVIPTTLLENEDSTSKDPSVELIAAETESTEITKERDIIKDFLEREQEFSTMGNSTRSIELVDVHLEDPPSDLSLTAEIPSGIIGGTVIENSVFAEDPNSELVGGVVGGVSLQENEGLLGGVVIPDVDEIASEEPITATLIGGISHAPIEESSPENPDLEEKLESSITAEQNEELSNEPRNIDLPEVVEQASAFVDDVLQEAADRQEDTITEVNSVLEKSLDPAESRDKLKSVEEAKPEESDEASLLKDESGSNHSRSSKESESLDDENPFISAEVKTLVQEQAPTVVDTDSQEDEADVIIPLNAEIGTIQETDEGKWDAQLALARAAIVIQKNFRKYLQRKNNSESFTRSEDVGKESTSTDSSLSSSATKIRQSSRTVESSRSDATNSFNESKLIKTKAKSMSTVPDSEVWDALEQELEESGNTQHNSHRQKLRREDAVQITTTASEESATESPIKQRLLGTGELHDLIIPEEENSPYLIN